MKFLLIFKGIDKNNQPLPHLRGDQQFELSQRAQINITIFGAQCLEWDLNFSLVFSPKIINLITNRAIIIKVSVGLDIDANH